MEYNKSNRPEKNLNQKDYPRKNYGTNSKAEISGKKGDELYQKALQYNRDLHKPEIDRWFGLETISQRPSEALGSILRTRYQYLEAMQPSQKNFSSVGENIFRGELHSNKEQLLDLHKEATQQLDNEQKDYNKAVKELQEIRTNIKELDTRMHLITIENKNLHDFATACLNASRTQGDTLNTLEQQIESAKLYSKHSPLTPFDNSEYIKSLENLRDQIIKQRDDNINEGQNRIKKWNENTKSVKEMKKASQDLAGLEQEYPGSIRDLQKNIKIYANLIQSLETIRDFNLADSERANSETNTQMDTSHLTATPTKTGDTSDNQNESFLTKQEIINGFDKIPKEEVFKIRKGGPPAKSSSIRKAFYHEINADTDIVSRVLQGRSIDIPRAKEAIATVLSKIEAKWNDPNLVQSYKNFYNRVREEIRKP